MSCLVKSRKQNLVCCCYVTLPLCVLCDSERKARKLYYYDLRERVLRSECRQQEEVYFQLAGYALQADLSDHVSEGHNHGRPAYFQLKEYFPPWVRLQISVVSYICI